MRWAALPSRRAERGTGRSAITWRAEGDAGRVAADQAGRGLQRDEVKVAPPSAGG